MSEKFVIDKKTKQKVEKLFNKIEKIIKKYLKKQGVDVDDIQREIRISQAFQEVEND